MQNAITKIQQVKQALINKGFEHISTTTDNGQDYNYGFCMFRHSDKQKVYINIETVDMLKQIHC